MLLAGAVAGGGLLVLLVSPARRPSWVAAPVPTAATALPGLLPASLAAFIVLAGGSALTGAATLDAGLPGTVVRGAGIGLLAAAGVVAARSALRSRRADSSPSARASATWAGALIIAWAGAALALVSWLLALVGVAVAIANGVRLEPRR